MVTLLASIVVLGYLALYVGGGAIAAKLVIPLVGLVYVLVRSLWIRVPDAEGIPLTADRKSGTLDSSMAGLGIRVGATWRIPLVAVVDLDGRVVAQWQGRTDPRPVMAAAEAVLRPLPH